MSINVIETKEKQLINSINSLKSLIVAYSGGVDSSLLAYYAKKILREKAKIVIAVSPSLAQNELQVAREQAQLFAWDLIEIQTNEVDKLEYQTNDTMRCYFCKSTLFDDLQKLSLKLSVKNIAYGANFDDLKDFRPGHKAAREYHVFSPLQEAGLTKDEIRILAHREGLPSWDRPQAACLSSRFQTYEPITIELLSQVDKAETYLRSLGFRQVRVRHHGEAASIEVEQNEIVKLTSDHKMMQQVSEYLKSLGWKSITVDINGYKQGSANVFKKDFRNIHESV